MKRIFLAIVFLAAGIAVYAQQQGGSNIPTSAQTKQSAQQFLNQAKTNSQGFESTLADLKARNGSNSDLATFNRLKSEIESLEERINTEEKSIRGSLDRGTKVNSEVMNRYENFINQHKAKMEELDTFVSSN